MFFLFQLEASQRELARATEELGRLQVHGGGEWCDRYLALDALYKDWDDRVQILKAEVKKQMEAYGRLQLELGEERAMRKMLEQQYASLKKKMGSQISGSFPYMGVLRSDISSASLGSVARPPPPAKRGRHEKGGSGSRLSRDGDGGDGGAEGGGES